MIQKSELDWVYGKQSSVKSCHQSDGHHDNLAQLNRNPVSLCEWKQLRHQSRINVILTWGKEWILDNNEQMNWSVCEEEYTVPSANESFPNLLQRRTTLSVQFSVWLKKLFLLPPIIGNRYTVKLILAKQHLYYITLIVGCCQTIWEQFWILYTIYCEAIWYETIKQFY